MAGAGKKTFVAGEVLLAQDVNDYLMDQTIMNFASDAARGSAIPTPSEGMLALSKDTDDINYYNGSAWVPALPMGAWKTWAPTLSAGWANGNGTWTAVYAEIGKVVHVYGNFALGSTTTRGLGFTCSLPVTGRASRNNFVFPARSNLGTGEALLGRMTATTSFQLFAQNSAGTYLNGNVQLDTAVPATWSPGNVISFAFTYEAA